MTQQEVEEIFLIYIAGCADPEDCARAEALLLAGDPQVHAAYAEAMAVVHSMPLALDRVNPPSHLCDQLLKRVDQHQADQQRLASGPMRIRPVWPSYLAAAIAACLAIALTISNHRRQQETNAVIAQLNQTEQQLNDTGTELDRVQAAAALANKATHAELASAQSALQQTQAKLASTVAEMNDARSLMRVPSATLASISKTEKGAGFGRVLYSPETRQFQVMVFDLQAPPAGKTYELWLITSDKRKLPAGTFTIDDKGSGTVMAHAPEGADVSLIAITDEPMGGVPAPTGEIRLAGALANANH